MKKISVITVGGMTCGGCARRVEAALKNVNGVDSVTVTLRTGEVKVSHDPAVVSETVLRACIASMGYQLRGEAA